MIDLRLITDAHAYSLLRYRLIRAAESEVRRVYLDSEGKATIGPGFLLFRGALTSQDLTVDGMKYSLAAGMRASAEIHLGTRTVLEYLVSPVRKAFHEAGRER